MKKEEIAYLRQLIMTMEQSERNLEAAYEKKDVEGFNRFRRFIIEINKRIESILK